MPLVPSGLRNEIKSRFTEIRGELGKYITVYSPPNTAACPNCFRDHTGASNNQYNTSFVVPVVIFGRTINPHSFTRGRCPVCFGKGYMEQDNKTVIKVVYRWNPQGLAPNGDMEKTSGGVEGFNVAFVRASRCYYELLRDCKKAVIDGVDCTLIRPPVLRSVGDKEVLAEAFFVSTDVGHSVKST